MRKFTALIASLLIVCLPLKGWAQVSTSMAVNGSIKSAVVSDQHRFFAIEKVANVVAEAKPVVHPCHTANADTEQNPDTGAESQSTCNACAVCHTTGAVSACLIMLTPSLSVSTVNVAVANSFTSAELSLALRPPAAI